MRWTTALLLLSILFPFATFAQSPVGVATQFVRGDANADGPVDLSDPVTILNYLFLSGPEPACGKAADSNDDGALDLSDGVSILIALFLSGPRPEPPYPACGTDPTPDKLHCSSYPACEFETLVSGYSVLRTVAGKGADQNANSWLSSFEGGPAAEAELSNPHFAQADAAGNIYIADKEAHAIRKVTPDGKIFTVAGMNEPGDDGDAPGPATQRHLFNPNGLQVERDGTLYILDTDNSKVRRVDTAGILTTLFTEPRGIAVGRGLWVAEDERRVYFSSGNELERWTPEKGVEVHSSGFSALGNITMDPSGNLVVTDRGAHRVYRIAADGSRTPIAGNGLRVGGGDGQPALQTGLNGVRGVWFLPSGGYFLATHEGSQIWHVDTRGFIHLFMNGRVDAHGGDGDHFRSPGFKVSEVRSVTVDPMGNLIVTENDYGFIRMVERR